jgi:hypothetical protein
MIASAAGRDRVVGLEVGDEEQRNPERARRLLAEVELRIEIGGRFGAALLVGRPKVVAEARHRVVEHAGEVRGAQVAEHAQGASRVKPCAAWTSDPSGACNRRQRVVRPEHVDVRVDEIHDGMGGTRDR